MVQAGTARGGRGGRAPGVLKSENGSAPTARTVDAAFIWIEQYLDFTVRVQQRWLRGFYTAHTGGKVLTSKKVVVHTAATSLKMAVIE